MNPLSYLLLAYNEFLFRPIFNLLVGLTNLLPNHNIGIAIIVVTCIVRFILLPSSIHQARQMQKNQKKMADLKDKLKDINEKFKDDKAKKAEATMKLYREAGVNPASGCLPLVIQLPILIALYRVFLIGIGPDTWSYLYSFVGAPEHVQFFLLGLELTKPSLLLGLLVGIAQLIQMRFFSPLPAPSLSGSDDESAKIMASFQRNMTYIFPVMMVFISWQLPAALGLYLLTSTLFGLVQQIIIKKLTHLPLPTPIA